MNRKKLISTIVLSAAFGSMLTVLFAGGLLRMTGIYGDDVLRLFGVMKFIQARYVSAPDTTALIDGAINGMVASLGDPHSVYMPPDMFKELRQHTEGAFGGIGVTMGFKDRTVKIISVLEGTPGEAAGLRAGDEILTVDGTPTSEMQSEEVALRIRGEAGTNVVLRILRDGTEQEYTITRAVIQVPSVRGVMIEGTTIGYIRIGSFAEHTGEEFSAEMKRLAGEGMTALGDLVNWGTERQPLLMGVIVAVIMGMVLTLPISSAALGVILGLSGVAAGASTIGCTTQMVGFAVASFRENRWGGLLAQGLGTSMLQVPNIVRHPLIWVPPTLASAILGPVATVVLHLESNAIGSGMGSAGLVGQIMTWQTMSSTTSPGSLLGLLLVSHFLAPALLTLVISEFMRAQGWIRPGDMALAKA